MWTELLWRLILNFVVVVVGFGFVLRVLVGDFCGVFGFLEEFFGLFFSGVEAE